MKGLLVCVFGLALTIGCSSPSHSTISSPKTAASTEPFIYVNGEFRNPNKFAWTNGMTLQDAINLAGGFTDFAHLKLKVHHPDGSSNFYRLKPGYRLTNNPPILPGDSVQSPRYYF